MVIDPPVLSSRDVSLDWMELTRSAVAKWIVPEFAEPCYVGLVTALAQCAGDQQAVPKNVAIAFSRNADMQLQVHSRATYNGQWFDYAAVLFPHWDREFTGKLQ